MKRIAFPILAIFCLATALQAQVAKPLEDPAIEQRMKHLTKELRCLVCQNETLADSQAPLAEDLRKEIRAQIKAGKTDAGNPGLRDPALWRFRFVQSARQSHDLFSVVRSVSSCFWSERLFSIVI